MDRKGVPNQYRPVPFWSWNEKLDTAETARQIALMDEAGLGGFFMHARGGLQTEYMGQEWFDNISVSIDEANQRDMKPWAYDEAGWPSGFGGGRVCQKGLKYQQKILRMSHKKPEDESRLLTVYGDYYFYYDVNPYYVDVLDAEVIGDFIREIYEPYYEKYGDTFQGFFTDEPQFSYGATGWSFTLPDEYRKAYGEELLEHLHELFLNVGEYKKTRVQYWKLITELFSKNFSKQIYDWCDSHGLKLTGHMLLEESFAEQIPPCGACMPNYEYYHIPAMDCLGRDVIWDLTAHQLGSAAQQMGRRQVLSETFAGCGHNVSFDELLRIYGHQMIHGVNLLCQHLQGYSMRGIRKRDWPPALYYQQPWWPYYERFNTAVSRIGQILAEGQVCCDTLLLHPQTSAWILYNGEKNEEIREFYQRFKKLIIGFDAMHVPFHLGDEIMIERHGRVEEDKFIIGQMAYSTVVVPEHICFFENTEKLLAQFKANGGKVVTPDQITADTGVIDNPNVLYTKRVFHDRTVYYFQNCTLQEQESAIVPGSYIIDLYSGEKRPFSGSYTFAPCEALLVADDSTPKTGAGQKTLKPLPLEGAWQVAVSTPNVLSLDTCDYYFDGVLEEKDGYILNIQNRAMALGHPVHIRMEYRICVEDVPENELYLVCETPQIYTIAINGKPVAMEDAGWFVDPSFRKLDIRGMLTAGENVLSLDVDFTQSPEIYERLRKAYQSESERNKLTYEMEIEPCYIIGDFGVRYDGHQEKIDRNAFLFEGRFPICKTPEQITLTQIEQQGYAFFAGELTVEKELDLSDTNYRLKLKKKSFNAVKVRINGQGAGVITFNGDSIDCSPYLHRGKNTITLTLVGTLRNMMGPHHRPVEDYRVPPRAFYKEQCVWMVKPVEWTDRYCFVELSVQSI